MNNIYIRLPFLAALFALASMAVSAQSGINYEPAFANLSFEYPVEIQQPGDGTDRLFVVEQPGRIKVFDNEEGVASTAVFLDATDAVSFSRGQEIGLLGLAFHPRYADNGYFYVYHNRRTNGGNGNIEMILARYTVDPNNPERADPNSRLEVFSFQKNQPQSNHNGGKIAFGPDGYLYVSIGDGGGGGDPRRNAQNLDNAFGSLLRIDVDTDGNNPASANNRYEIPADNPRVGRSGLDELYAWGLRNTWKFAFDPVTDLLYGGDVGQNAREEINILTAGGNYGWNRFEGNGTFNSGVGLVTQPAIAPIHTYEHRNGDRSITLGPVYRGRLANPAIQGKLIFADYISGRVWALDYDADRGETNVEFLFRTNGEAVSSFGVDASGELYFSGYGSRAQLFRIIDENDDGGGDEPVSIAGVGSWSSLDQGITGTVEAAVRDGDRLYVGGTFTVNGNSPATNLAVYEEGAGWSSLAGGANGRVSALTVDGNGRLYAGGEFTAIGGVAAQNVAVWDGEEWQGLGSGTSGPVLTLHVNENGRLFAGGTFADAGGIEANNIASWDGQWSPLADGNTGVSGTNNEVRSIATDAGGVVYVGGNFASAGGRVANRIATFDGDTWGTLGSGTSGFVQAIVVTDATIYVGGNFAEAGDQSVNRIAAWDRLGQQWEAVSGGTSGNVNALDFNQGYLYAAGNFATVTAADGTNYLVNNIARWSAGTDWEALGENETVGTDNQISTLARSVGETDLYAGGNFTAAGAAAATRVARWSFTPIPDGAIFSLQPQYNPELRLGVFEGSGDNRAPMIALPQSDRLDQQWEFISRGSDLYELAPQHAPGMRLDVSKSSQGGQYIIHSIERHGRANQVWRVLPVGDGTYRLQPTHRPTNRLAVLGQDALPFARSRVLNTDDEEQRWRFIPVPAGTRSDADRSVAETDLPTTDQRLLEMGMRVYPNPADERLVIESQTAEYRFQLFDATGRELLSASQAAGTHRVDVADLPAGLYVVRLLVRGEDALTTQIVIN